MPYGCGSLPPAQSWEAERAERRREEERQLQRWRDSWEQRLAALLAELEASAQAAWEQCVAGVRQDRVCGAARVLFCVCVSWVEFCQQIQNRWVPGMLSLPFLNTSQESQAEC